MSTVSSTTLLNFNGYTTSPLGGLVAKTSDSGMADTAVSLSAEADLVATLGGGALSTVTYDAAGLLNTLMQAGSASPTTQVADNSADPQAAAQNSTDQGIVGLLPSASITSGIYSSSGSPNSLPSNISANWASILKTDPSLAPSVISDSFNQGIVGTLSTTA